LCKWLPELLSFEGLQLPHESFVMQQTSGTTAAVRALGANGGSSTDAVDTTETLERKCVVCQSTEEVRVFSANCERLCVPCFVERFERSFRYAVQRWSMLSHGERVAVALSGGPASLALLELLHGLRRGFAHHKGKIRPKHFEIVVFHVIVPAGYGGNGASGAAALQALVQERYGLTVHTVDEALFLARADALEMSTRDPMATNHQLDVLDPTIAPALVAGIVNALLERMAEAYECKKLFLGTTVTRAAIITIARVATGNPLRLDAEIGVDYHSSTAGCQGSAYASSGPLRWLRPLRNISLRDVIRYLRARGCTAWITPAEPWAQENIESTAERFIWRALETRPATSFSVVHSIERALNLSAD